MSKHTPGPWDALRDGVEIQSSEGHHEILACVNGQPITVATVINDMRFEYDDPVSEYHLGQDEALANLTLLAAAPSMKYALQDLLRRFDRGENSNLPCIIEARSAIARATGNFTS